MDHPAGLKNVQQDRPIRDEEGLIKNGSSGKNFFPIRRQVQLALFIATIATGLQFYIYVAQAMRGGEITVPRPEGVEGFLPIGALMAWKNFILSGEWDPFHPAAMVILGFAVVLSLAFRKAFCGWFCPIGTLSEWAWRAGAALGVKHHRLPGWIDWPLRSVKYALLGFFVYIILQMTPKDIESFLQSPYYKIADVKMLYFFTHISWITAGVLILLVILSLFFRNFWCRHLCPYGALLGIVATASPFRVQRNAETCTGCGGCHRACAFHLPVHVKKEIRTPECSGCMDCMAACPEKNTLAFRAKGFKSRLNPFQMGFLILASFIAIVYLAKISGHWKSRLPEHEFRSWMTISDFQKIGHPSIPER